MLVVVWVRNWDNDDLSKSEKVKTQYMTYPLLEKYFGLVTKASQGKISFQTINFCQMILND